MNRRPFQYIVFTVLLLSPFSPLHGQPLSTVKSNDHRVQELLDVYTAFHVNNIVTEQKETLSLLHGEISSVDFNDILKEFIRVCDSTSAVRLSDSVLNTHVHSFLSSTARNYRTALKHGFTSTAFKQDLERYRLSNKTYFSYLYSRYSTKHFIALTEEQYWKGVDKQQFIHSKEFETYKKLKRTNIAEAVDLLQKIVERTADAQESSVYAIELADQYVMHPDSTIEDAVDSAIAIYKRIIDRKQYSLFLFEAWVKWRTVTQDFFHGSSRSSDIPNRDYDRVREEAAVTVLRHITKDRKDDLAVNQFLLLATHDIVKRFGEYQYGNQNAVEFHNLFSEP